MTTKKGLFITDDGKNVVVIFALVSSLFLLWGFCNGMIDVMDRHFQSELHLTLGQSAWVQFAHYLGYFLMSLPAGWLAIKLGYKGGIITGLLLVACGGFWFIPATHIAAFWAFLLGVCLIASGLTFLETIANPYTTVLGPKEYGAARINLAQSGNSIGWFLGPLAGARYFYSKDAAGNSTGAQTLWIPYVGVAVVVLVLAALFYVAEVPDIKVEDEYHLDDSTSNVSHSIWKHPHFIFAIAAQFFYVGAQASIFGFFIFFMTSQVPPIPPSWNFHFISSWFEMRDGVLHVSDAGGSYLQSAGFLCFFAGRYTGSQLLKRYSASSILGLYGIVNVVVCSLIFAQLGWISTVCIFLSFFFMSVMFPTIFALGIHGLGARAKRAASFIVMAIMGGAVLSKVTGRISDMYGVSHGFIIPLVCFLFVAIYGFAWPKLSRSTSSHESKPVHPVLH